jgi:hypothetical protein
MLKPEICKLYFKLQPYILQPYLRLWPYVVYACISKCNQMYVLFMKKKTYQKVIFVMY